MFSEAHVTERVDSPNLDSKPIMGGYVSRKFVVAFRSNDSETNATKRAKAM